MLSGIEILCNDKYYQRLQEFAETYYLNEPLFEKISNINPGDHLYENIGPIIWLDELVKGLQNKLYEIYNGTISKNDYVDLIQAQEREIPMIILKPKLIQENIFYLFKKFNN